MTVLFAAGIGLGSAVGGLASGDAILGCASLGLYAAAIVGIGVAVGGLWRTSIAAEIAALVVVATYLLDLVAPPLKLPDWLHQLALTAHFGKPMVGEWDMVGVVACLVIAVGGILLGAWGMRAARRGLMGEPRRRTAPRTRDDRAAGRPLGVGGQRDRRPGRRRPLRLGRRGRPALPRLPRRRVGPPVPRRAAPLRDARPRGRPGGPLVVDDPAASATGYRRAFAGFDPVVVAGFDDADVARLLADAGHRPQPAQGGELRSRTPGRSSRSGEAGGSLVDLLWGFVGRRAARPAGGQPRRAAGRDGRVAGDEHAS